MTAAAISMMIFGLMLTWGGAAFCIYTAMKRRRTKYESPSFGWPSRGMAIPRKKGEQWKSVTCEDIKSGKTGKEESR